MNSKMCFLITFALISLQFSVECHNSNENTFAVSIASMETLIEMERILIESVTEFTAELETKVEKLKNLVTLMHEENQRAVENPERYLLNPLNGYSLIRRMYYDWPNIELYMTNAVGEAHLEVMRKLRPQMATTTDMEEATEGIYRLQHTYGINCSDMAKGLLNGKQYEPSLKSIDQYFLGHYLFVDGKHNHAALWTELAIISFDDTDYNGIIDYTKEKLYLLYAEALMKLSRPKDALIAMQHALDLKPQDARFLKLRNDIQLESSYTPGESETNSIPEENLLELLCRGHSTSTPTRYHCLYNTTASPYSLLAPFKMEILHLDPFLVIYHDVISDAEIDEYKAISRPVLQRATVYGNTSRIVRSAKYMGYHDNSTNTTSRLNRRIEDMTGFDVNKSEPLQVINYGLGGHYEAHFDFFVLPETHEFVAADGNRLATVLFYLSDVEQGGATIFPELNITVVPRKGSAIVWYNLKNDVDIDMRTLHLACPVLVGSKWVATKWIRSNDQMFRRPCYR